MKIKSVIGFLQVIEKQSPHGIYRGHLKEDWVLLPSIVRYYEQSDKRSNPLSTIEHDLIGEFVRYSTPFKDYRHLPYIEKLVDAQHYGLPTRLLDWTTNPLKGLFFAVEDPDFDVANGAVYWLEPELTSVWAGGTRNVSQDDDFLSTIYPELLNERLSAQEGCFTVFPLPKITYPVPKDGDRVLPLTFENYSKDLKSLEKIVIEAKSKKQIRIELDKLGINHRTMFPGLDGVAKLVKSDYFNLW